ncbi:MAG: penicillin-binding transpeptidase domain-containing protein [Oscillospiraceae bacterium]
MLALASYPTYDLNRWDEMYDSWSKDPALPMFNRATDGTYAPGSTFKLCTSVAGLESGVITPPPPLWTGASTPTTSSPSPSAGSITPPVAPTGR